MGELARREFTLAFPAAKRAASHAAQAFFKKFSEEYAKERKEALEELDLSPEAVTRFGARGAGSKISLTNSSRVPSGRIVWRRTDSQQALSG